MITSKKYGKIILVLLMSLTFWLFPRLITADDHEKGHNDSKQLEIRKEYDDQDNEEDDDKREGKEDDEGNEVTGQIALWLLVAANLNIALSIIVTKANRFLPLSPETITSIRRFNQLQKNYLMRFHYVLSPIGLCIAIFHFSLSSCSKTFLPEWGLILMLLMVVLGLMLKFKASPKRIRGFVYRLHTSPASFSALILVLVVGHLVVD